MFGTHPTYIMCRLDGRQTHRWPIECILFQSQNKTITYQEQGKVGVSRIAALAPCKKYETGLRHYHLADILKTSYFTLLLITVDDLHIQSAG
jgi:hypothetical protein